MRPKLGVAEVHSQDAEGEMLSQRAPLPTDGAALLVIIRKTTNARQRRAALEALAIATDPPPEALGAIVRFALDPRADDATRVAVLCAATRAVLVHDQRDLQALRGVILAEDAPDELDQRLTEFAERLDHWAAVEGDVSADLHLAARHLALVLHRVAPAPIAKVQVVRCEPETPENSVAGIVDGVWDSTDPRTMWLHSASQFAAVLLDLGEEQPIVGVRIWNANLAGDVPRGWRTVEVFVGATEEEMTNVARGAIPPAPRQSPASDYGTTLLIPPTRARYVRLQAESFLSDAGQSGLSEIQVLR